MVGVSCCIFFAASCLVSLFTGSLTGGSMGVVDFRASITGAGIGVSAGGLVGTVVVVVVAVPAVPASRTGGEVDFLVTATADASCI